MFSTINESLEYFSFDIFKQTGLINAIFTRKGGVSPNPWYSLNQGGTTGDSRINVIENRYRAFNVLGLQVNSIFDVWQVHGIEPIIANKPRDLDTPHAKADIIITNKPGVSLFMRFADCVPIFLFDKKHHVISLVHAGWKGTVSQISKRAIEVMKTSFGTNVCDLLVGIGPCIGLDHFEVQGDVLRRFKKIYNSSFDHIHQSFDNHYHINLEQANLITLKESGVEYIETAGLCTACDLSRWYSHRAENGKTGRFGALFSLPK